MSVRHAFMSILCTMFRPGANESQKWTLDFLKLELEVTVSYLWVLGFEARSVERAASALNHLSSPLVVFC